MALPSNSHWASSSNGFSRRESPRIEVEAVLDGKLARGNLRLSLVDLSFGGFSVESVLAFPPSTRHMFRFTTASGVAVNVRADAVYSRPSGMHDGADQFVAGFKYVVASQDDERGVDILLSAASSQLVVF
jgi:hypothetical protein